MLKQLFRRGLLAATAVGVVALGLSAGAAEARTNRALLVAVTAYPNLPKKNWLVGPNHDAELVREYLISNSLVPFEAGNVTVLADGLDGAVGSPTKAAILANLKTLADQSQPGDFIYLHFSGHGSQQPELAKGKETDGLDEIFLPADTQLWKDRDAGVPNALMDDEFGAALDAIRAKGAFIWFVIDACHSGTATRDVLEDGPEAKDREIKPGDLEIPADLITQAESTRAPATRGVGEQTRESALMLTDTAEPQGATPLKGGLVAFYAAQTTETTPERPMPRGKEGATSYGVFTYTLFQRMAENPNMTYRQLGQAILQQYAADSQTKPTPLFEGDLDARVFGTEEIDTVMQWPVVAKAGKLELSAGMLHRLAPGTKLAVLPSPTSEMKEAVGYLEVTTVKNLVSEARPVAFDGKPALEMSAIPPQAYARLSELAVTFQLKVARPPANDQLAKEVELVNAALDELAANPEKRFNIELVDAGEDADLRLAVLRENEVEGAAADASSTPALWFLPPSGQIAAEDGSKPPLVAIDLANPKKLSDAAAVNLQKIFRATSLARLSLASDYKPDQVSVNFLIKREDKDAMEPLDGSTVPYVNPGDQVHILAENKSSRRVDINVLYIGSDYSITHITAQRLEAGAKLEEGLLAFTDESFGLERMVAVLTEAPPGSETEDLSFLEQGKVPPATRAAGEPSGFSSILNQIAEVPATRGAAAFKVNDGGGPKGGVMIFGVETQPRQ
jgi:hypothetical protein